MEKSNVFSVSNSIPKDLIPIIKKEYDINIVPNQLL